MIATFIETMKLDRLFSVYWIFVSLLWLSGAFVERDQIQNTGCGNSGLEFFAIIIFFILPGLLIFGIITLRNYKDGDPFFLHRVTLLALLTLILFIITVIIVPPEKNSCIGFN